MRFLLRWLGRLAYLGLLLVVFVTAAYLSFNVFVRGGVTRVPDLTGASEEEGRDRLADAGLALRRRADEVRYDARIPAGHVLRQDPGAGSYVKRGSAVEVILSSGPQRLAVPGLVGQALTAAQVTLIAAGLRPGASGNVYAAGTPAGLVVAQSPAAGDLVEPTTPVALLAALDDESETYLMPDLVYRRFEDVRSFFDARGFRLGSIKYEPYEGIADGTVLRQFPLAGHPLHHNDIISLVVATSAPVPEDGAPANVLPAGPVGPTPVGEGEEP